MLLIFEIVFSDPVKSQIKSIGGGQMGGDKAEDEELEVTIWTQTAVLWLWYLT